MSVNKGVEMSFKLRFKDGLSFSLPAAFMVVTAAKMPVVLLSVLPRGISSPERIGGAGPSTSCSDPVPSHGRAFPAEGLPLPCPLHKLLFIF